MEHPSPKELRLPSAAFKYLAVLNALVCVSVPIVIFIYLMVASRTYMITKIFLMVTTVLFLLFLALGSAINHRKVKNTRCIFGDPEIVIVKGRIFRVEHHIPRSSIIHYRITSSSLKRTFDLAAIEFHTLQGIIPLGPLSKDDTTIIAEMLTSDVVVSSGSDIDHV